jgi:acyl dehydratase
MPLNPDFVGRSVSSTEPFEVTRGDIRRFAEAIGDPQPAYVDTDAARALGHPDVVAPPTFLITMGGGGGSSLLEEPGLGLQFAMLVHGEQEFTLLRPICAGDRLDSTTRIADIRAVGRNELMTLVTEVTCDGQPVALTRNTIVSRGTAFTGEPAPG